MYISGDNVYVRKGERYVKCVLREDDAGHPYLTETKVAIDQLPSNCHVATFAEVIAQLGHNIAEPSEASRKEK